MFDLLRQLQWNRVHSAPDVPNSKKEYKVSPAYRYELSRDYDTEIDWAFNSKRLRDYL